MAGGQKRELTRWMPTRGGSTLVAKGLPSILQFHLKRFHYDWETDTTTKLNNRFSFTETLDLSSLCGDITEEEQSLATYVLQAVVVHVGEYGTGHYYAYIRPDIESEQWYRFNDHMVQEVIFDEVTADAFGGLVNDAIASAESKGGGVLKRVQRFFNGRGRRGSGPYGWGGETSNAYILQYVRHADIGMLYHPKDPSS
jgi:Ubiquitin carboxyl-terminal hydrolase